MRERSPKAVAVGSRIATKREQKGLSQTELATKLGVTSGAVGQYETGRNLPKLARLERIALELDTTTEWLLTGDDPDELVRAQTDNELAMLRVLRKLPADHQGAAVAMLQALLEGITKS